MTAPRIPPDGSNSPSGKSTGTPKIPAPQLPRLPLAQRVAHLPPPPPVPNTPPATLTRRTFPPPPPPIAHPPANALPQLPRDVWANIIGQVDDERTLYRLRAVNKTFHRISNELIQRICLDLVAHNAAEYGFTVRGKRGEVIKMPVGRLPGVLFRGDTRPPSIVFGLGFTKSDDVEPHTSGEKVEGVISTSKDPNIPRRKYSSIGSYVYAVAGFPGIDTLDFNDLEEVAAFFIPPECVIGAIGPVAAFDKEAYLLVIQDPQVLMNGNCRLGDEARTAASNALRGLCRAP